MNELETKGKEHNAKVDSIHELVKSMKEEERKVVATLK